MVASHPQPSPPHFRAGPSSPPSSTPLSDHHPILFDRVEGVGIAADNPGPPVGGGEGQAEGEGGEEAKRAGHGRH